MQYISVGKRFVAVIIDSVVLLIVGYLIAVVFGGTNGSGFYLSGGTALLWVALSFLYYIVMEGLYGGTLGKLAVGIRVVREDGSPLDWGSSVVRNILRIADTFFLGYIVGAISVWSSDKRQRVGDRVAGTVVVPREASAVRTADGSAR